MARLIICQVYLLSTGIRSGKVQLSLIAGLLLMISDASVGTFARAAEVAVPKAGKSSQWLQERAETTTTWYYNANAVPEHLHEHLLAREENLPPPSADENGVDRGPDWEFVRTAHIPAKGEGLVLGYKEITRTYGPLFLRTYAVRQLSIFVPLNDITGSKNIKIDNSGEIIVLWSSWGHQMPHCFAYATRGEIVYDHYSIPPDIEKSWQDIVPPGDEKRFDTIAVQWSVQFEDVVDEARWRSGGKRAGRCPSFELTGYQEFYWRPLNEIQQGLD